MAGQSDPRLQESETSITPHTNTTYKTKGLTSLILHAFCIQESPPHFRQVWTLKGQQTWELNR